MLSQRMLVILSAALLSFGCREAIDAKPGQSVEIRYKGKLSYLRDCRHSQPLCFAIFTQERGAGIESIDCDKIDLALAIPIGACNDP